MVCEDKNDVIFNQYDLDINRVYRVKGAYVIDTGTEKKILREYRFGEGKARLVNYIMQHLKNQGYSDVDMICENRSKNLISENQYRNRFVLRDYFEGEECDLISQGDILNAVDNLAKIHTMLHSVDFSFLESMQEEEPVSEEADILSAASTKDEKREVKIIVPTRNIKDTLYNHARELRRVFRYMCAKKKKNDFEVEYIKNYSMFARQPLYALQQLDNSDYDKLMKQVIINGSVTHGEYTHHNIIMNKEGSNNRCAVTGFEKASVGIQIYDLYSLLRKVMEKNNWDYDIGSKMINTYINTRSKEHNDVTSAEITVLYALIIFPEKLWKITDYYYNRRKTWLSQKMLDKILKLESLEKKREEFIKYFEGEFI